MQEKPTPMKNSTKYRTIVIICLFLLIYSLTILIEKRINPYTEFDFKLWTPYYLIFIVIIPLTILLPIRFLPSSRYSKFIIQKENRINKVVVILTGIILTWFLLWYTMIGIGDLIENSLKISEAEITAETSIKNDSIIYSKIGFLESIESISQTISSKTANFKYILRGQDTILDIEILLRKEQIWVVDTIIIK
jgi:hypothetical protein